MNNIVKRYQVKRPYCIFVQRDGLSRFLSDVEYFKEIYNDYIKCYDFEQQFITDQENNVDYFYVYKNGLYHCRCYWERLKTNYLKEYNLCVEDVKELV